MSAQQADSVWTPALAGAFSGFVTRLVTGPLDTLKIRNQLHWQHGKDPNPSLLALVRGIVAEEGVLALWKGTVPGMCLWMSYSFVQFGVFDALQSSAALRRLDEHFPAALLSGAVAASTATLVTYPFDIIRTQFVVQGQVTPYTSMRAFVRSAVDRRGVSAFYTGLSAAILGVAPYMGLNFFLYARAKALLAPLVARDGRGDRGDRAASLWQLLSTEGLAGAAAGGLAKLTFYPLDTMKRRLQASILESTLRHSVGDGPLAYASLLDCFVGVWRREGVRSFYKGMVPTLLKAVASSAVGFVSFESAKRLLEPGAHR